MHSTGNGNDADRETAPGHLGVKRFNGSMCGIEALVQECCPGSKRLFRRQCGLVCFVLVEVRVDGGPRRGCR